MEQLFTFCTIVHHKNKKKNQICIEPNCQHERLMCELCHFELHQKHSFIPFSLFLEICTQLPDQCQKFKPFLTDLVSQHDEFWKKNVSNEDYMIREQKEQIQKNKQHMEGQKLSFQQCIEYIFDKKKEDVVRQSTEIKVKQEPGQLQKSSQNQNNNRNNTPNKIIQQDIIEKNNINPINNIIRGNQNHNNNSNINFQPNNQIQTSDSNGNQSLDSQANYINNIKSEYNSDVKPKQQSIHNGNKEIENRTQSSKSNENGNFKKIKQSKNALDDLTDSESEHGEFKNDKLTNSPLGKGDRARSYSNMKFEETHEKPNKSNNQHRKNNERKSYRKSNSLSKSKDRYSRSNSHINNKSKNYNGKNQHRDDYNNKNRKRQSNNNSVKDKYSNDRSRSRIKSESQYKSSRDRLKSPSPFKSQQLKCQNAEYISKLKDKKELQNNLNAQLVPMKINMEDEEFDY